MEPDGNDFRVLPYLGEIASEMREEGSFTRAELAVAVGGSEDKVRYFERGNLARQVDDMVNALSVVSGIPAIELWRDALARASSRSSPADAGDSADAKAFARLAIEADNAEKASEQPGEKRASKATRRKAG